MDRPMFERRSTLLDSENESDLRQVLGGGGGGGHHYRHVEDEREDRLDIRRRESNTRYRSRSPILTRTIYQQPEHHARRLSDFPRHHRRSATRYPTYQEGRASNYRRNSHENEEEHRNFRPSSRGSRSSDRSSYYDTSRERRTTLSPRNASTKEIDYDDDEDDERPASPMALEDFEKLEEERERKEKEQKERDEKDEKLIADSLEDLEEVDEVIFPPIVDNKDEKDAIKDETLSLSSLPSTDGDKDQKPAVDEDVNDSKSSIISFELDSLPEEKEAEVVEVKQSREKELVDQQNLQEISSSSSSSSSSIEEIKIESVKEKSASREHETSPFSDDDIFEVELSWPAVVNKGKACLICKEVGHIAKQCEKLVCYKCNEGGHFAKECKNPAKPKPKKQTFPPNPSNPMPSTSSNQNMSDNHNQHNKYDHQKMSDHQQSSVITCYICKSTKHQIKYCPNLVCKKCGALGHFAKECMNLRDQFKSKKYLRVYAPDPAPPPPPPAPRMIPKPPKISFDYDNSSKPTSVSFVSSSATGSAWDDESLLTPKQSLQDFYSEKQMAQGKPASYANDMILTWRMAGHTEETLKSLFVKERPSSAVQLRLVFVKELGHVPAGQIPMSLNISDLLDVTVEYFMAKSSRAISSSASGSVRREQPSFSSEFRGGAEVNNPMSSWESALHNVSSMERFRQLDNDITQLLVKNPQVRQEYEGRLQTLQPLQVFLLKRMQVMSHKFGISDSFMYSVSVIIQKLIAYVGLCMFTLRRMLATFGMETLEESVTEKLTPYSDSFPAGFSLHYLVSIIKEYVQEVSR